MPYLLLCLGVLATLFQSGWAEDKIMHGSMNSKCTSWNRTCIREAECLNQTCVCKGTSHGDGMITCADEHDHLCLVKADPHMVSFGQATGDIPLPCRYRLATFTTPFEEESLGWTCSFEISAFNVISQSGRYFAAGVEVKFAVGATPTESLREQDYIKFEISHGGVIGSDASAHVWGSDFQSLFNNVVIRCKFDPQLVIATFCVPKCGLSIRFRAYDEDDEPGVQIRMPGVSIAVTKEAEFNQPFSGYPKSLCGRPDDPDTLYEDRGQELTVNASTRAILYDVLELGKHISQELLIKSQTRLLLPYSAECSRTVNMFHTCEGVEEKSRAIRICAKILTARRLVQCLRKDVLETFIACLDAVCNDGSSCIILRGNLNYIAYVDPVKCRVPKRILESGICHF